MNNASLSSKQLLILALVLLGLVSGCEPAASRPFDPAQMVDSGSWYSRERWPHDGNPYESPNFVVYSDAASPKARQEVAEIGEELLTELRMQFGIDADEMFLFPEGQDKIHIYAFKNRNPQNWGGRSYYGGLLIYSLDHKERGDLGYTDMAVYEPVVTHELVHVVESLVKGRDGNDGQRVDAWFSEGLAEAISGGTQGGAIRDLDHFNDLTAEYGLLSPITYKADTVDINSEAYDPLIYWYYYYPMSQLAVEFLMDSDGLGKSPKGVTSIYVDMADGASFASTFETHMGISLSEYEGQFFDLISGYLD